ncbi:MAG: cysteine desulfurase [Clostridiales bacterium]|nr:cysteine desulfurase [Clostridiales bacterium]
MSAYLDNSATTKPCRECVEAVVKMMESNYGNPSSLHNLGIDAMKEIILARSIIANSLSAEREEIIFTSGGTEANNLAVFGAVKAKKRLGNTIVTTAVEHESVLQSVNELEKQGFEVIYLQPDKNGNITEEQIFDAVNSKTILVSVMYINNEVGTLMPVKSISRAVKKANAPALIHIDCVQAYGKIPINAKKLGADLITVSAHKIHGPKGVGALYVSKSAHLTSQNFSITFGGEQEQRLRPGTESAPLIAGFAAAVKALPSASEQKENISQLCAYARQKLSDIDGVVINNPADSSPYIINLYVPTFMRSQTVIQELSSNYQVYVSNGSACAKGKRSHVLSAMGLSDEIIDKSIRISFSRYNTKEDVDLLISSLNDLIKKHPKG